MLSLSQVLVLANRNISGGIQEANARFCFDQATDRNIRGDEKAARMWAIKSLGFSVGVFHPDHKKASAA